MSYGYHEWRPYVPVAERRRKAARAMEKLAKKGHPVSPVAIEGRKIALTFWGKAWCENLERYGDYANRLPRGRTYVRNGSVVDLQVEAGAVRARVMGSSLYTVQVRVKEVAKARWDAICRDCAGAIDSLVELLQGRFAKGVMERICREQDGLFPAPAEIEFSCSCPDWASMCKHVAATLYGVGARLDAQPELLFRLRKVDEQRLIAGAAAGVPLAKQGPASAKVLAYAELGAVFGIEMAELAADAGEGTQKPARARRGRKERGAGDANASPRGGKPGGRKRAAGERAAAEPVGEVAALARVVRTRRREKR